MLSEQSPFYLQLSFGSDSIMEQKLEELAQMRASATQRRLAVLAKAKAPVVDRPPGIFVSGSDKPREPKFPPTKASEPKAPVIRPVEDPVPGVTHPALVAKAKPSCAPVSSEAAVAKTTAERSTGTGEADLLALVQKYSAEQIVDIVRW